MGVDDCLLLVLMLGSQRENRLGRVRQSSQTCRKVYGVVRARAMYIQYSVGQRREQFSKPPQTFECVGDLVFK